MQRPESSILRGGADGGNHPSGLAQIDAGSARRGKPRLYKLTNGVWICRCAQGVMGHGRIPEHAYENWALHGARRRNWRDELRVRHFA